MEEINEEQKRHRELMWGQRPKAKKYDPADPHFNPLHPPEDYPKELLEAEWGKTFDDEPNAGK